MSASSGSRLVQHSEKVLHHPVKPHLISLCPTMDLIAVVTEEEELEVYRLNGQRVLDQDKKKKEVAATNICWQYNGESVAVSWSDGSVQWITAGATKVLETSLPPPLQDGSSTVTCMGWALHFMDPERVKKRVGQEEKPNGHMLSFSAEAGLAADVPGDETTLEDFLQRMPDLEKLEVDPDLPDQIATLDLETLLPKLPPVPMQPVDPMMRHLPPPDGGRYGTQAQVDSFLHMQRKDHNSVQIFIRCTDQGTVHPTIYDSTDTVDVELPKDWNLDRSRPILHRSHPYSCSHGLLTEVTRAGKTQLAFVPLTLGFIPAAGVYLHPIASKTVQLQNLLAYIEQSVQTMFAFYKQSRFLPDRFMRNVSETLEEKNQGTLVENLFHLACTGNCPAIVKEWLVDELQEAGHKRWEQYVMSFLTFLRQIIHENLLPALDRCTIILSRFRGLAKYYESGWIFTTPVSEFNALLEKVRIMRLLGHTALLHINEERRSFFAFSKWLKYEIDYQSTDPLSQTRQEIDNRDPGVDVGMVVNYIRYGLLKSDIEPFVRLSQALTEEQRKTETSYDDTLKEIKLMKKGDPYRSEVLSLEAGLMRLYEGCQKLFQDISQWQRDNISMDCGIVLEDDCSDAGKAAAQSPVVDMRMVCEADSESQPSNSMTTYISFLPPSNRSILHLHRAAHDPTLTSLPTQLHAYSATTLDFTPHATILDAKFTDDNNLLILLQLRNKVKTSLLLSIPYTPSASPTSITPLPYTSLPNTELDAYCLPNGSPIPVSKRQVVRFEVGDIESYTVHTFDDDFAPAWMGVNGRKDRRVVLVLAEDRRCYEVLDLDLREEEGKGDE
ncbi:hypothetical protein M011DRAFT_461216 [Sporormia fimetaria CBS 119925]|uniref:Anaphase-promoting complex subunit 4 n=1 Tax=Sporormia fimetaria CBS 119925 TaxID=1340428 RepID=A0A6A6V3S5_9PLEO|nr:hypothetical protein M011DRAFT_461216 [Sporormia fimetaria CBS 119925]